MDFGEYVDYVPKKSLSKFANDAGAYSEYATKRRECFHIVTARFYSERASHVCVCYCTGTIGLHVHVRSLLTYASTCCSHAGNDTVPISMWSDEGM